MKRLLSILLFAFFLNAFTSSAGDYFISASAGLGGNSSQCSEAYCLSAYVASQPVGNSTQDLYRVCLGALCGFPPGVASMLVASNVILYCPSTIVSEAEANVSAVFYYNGAPSCKEYVNVSASVGGAGAHVDNASACVNGAMNYSIDTSVSGLYRVSALSNESSERYSCEFTAMAAPPTPSPDSSVLVVLLAALFAFIASRRKAG